MTNFKLDFLTAIQNYKYIRRTSDIQMWEDLGYYDYWFEVAVIHERSTLYYGINLQDILAEDWEGKNE